MSTSAEHALYRIRRTRRRGLAAKRYRGTWELSDESTSRVLASCDLMGAATFGEHAITDDKGDVWHLAANRAIMPSRWLLSDPTQRLALQFGQQILRKLANPLRRTALTLLDGDGKMLFQLIDPRKGVLDRMFGTRLDDWVLMAQERPVAEFVRLAKSDEKPKGLLDRVNRFLVGMDYGLASAGPSHTLAAPAALALIMLVHELTDSSAA